MPRQAAGLRTATGPPILRTLIIYRTRQRCSRKDCGGYDSVMPNPRLSLALERIGPGDWEIFEKFASEFLAVEYPTLRTMAAPNGDKGRDAEIFTIDGVPKVAFQYSVTASWKTK